MREIEFRGKRIDNNEWVYGDYSEAIEKGDNGATEVYYQETNTKLTYINNQLVYPNTVGQYTGIKDDLDKKIYENDIVLYTPMIFSNRKSFKGIVKILEGSWCIDNGKKAIYLWTEINELEKLGNATDNPELLKEM